MHSTKRTYISSPTSYLIKRYNLRYKATDGGENIGLSRNDLVGLLNMVLIPLDYNQITRAKITCH